MKEEKVLSIGTALRMCAAAVAAVSTPDNDRECDFAEAVLLSMANAAEKVDLNDD